MIAVRSSPPSEKGQQPTPAHITRRANELRDRITTSVGTDRAEARRANFRRAHHIPLVFACPGLSTSAWAQDDISFPTVETVATELIERISAQPVVALVLAATALWQRRWGSTSTPVGSVNFTAAVTGLSAPRVAGMGAPVSNVIQFGAGA